MLRLISRPFGLPFGVLSSLYSELLLLPIFFNMSARWYDSQEKSMCQV